MPIVVYTGIASSRHDIELVEHVRMHFNHILLGTKCAALRPLHVPAATCR